MSFDSGPDTGGKNIALHHNKLRFTRSVSRMARELPLDWCPHR
jgi:hypothetical protein